MSYDKFKFFESEGWLAYDAAKTWSSNLIKQFQVSPLQLASIRQIALSIIKEDIISDEVSLENVNNFEELIVSLRKTNTVTIRKSKSKYFQLESVILDALEKVVPLENFAGIEFPVNLRVSHPVAPTGYLEIDTPTDHFHCDPWAGEPKDTVNFFMYLYGSKNASSIELLDVNSKEISRLQKFVGAYRDAQSLIEDFSAIKYEPKSGSGFLFNPFVPHRTKRVGTDIRISIDFRLRLQDPYKIIDENWSHPRVPWSRYWNLPEKSDLTFESRCQTEIDNLKKRGLTAIASEREGLLNSDY